MSDRDEQHSFDDDAVPEGYIKQTVKLSAAHRWKAAPGYNILVLDAGALRMEYPHGWHVIPTGNNLNIHDRTPPDDEGRFQITVFRLPPLAGASWDDLPLEQLLREATGRNGERRRRRRQPQSTLVHDVTGVRRPDLEYAWRESSAPDPENGRAIFSRQTLARARGVQPLVTFDYYASRADDYLPVWQHAIDSLRLGAPVNLLGDSSN